TVSGNTSGDKGAGIFSRKITLNSSTVSGNTAATMGGGIYSDVGGVDITHSTVTRNTATTGDGGGVWNNNSPINVFASIIARNTAAGGAPDLRRGSGTLTVEYSLIGDNAGTTLAESHSPDANGNLIGSSAGSGIIDPRLAPLDVNGGPTQTHAVLADSPAIDAIPVPVPPTPAHDYQLNNSLADALGGPSLVSQGGNLTSIGYIFDPNEGLNLSDALSNPAQYSIELLFRFDSGSGGWHKIVDFKNLTANTGLYRAGNGLHFLDRVFTPNVFEAGVICRLILTRDDESDAVRGFINGTEIWSFLDVAGEAVFDGPEQIIRFFQDDNTTGQAEASHGFVDLIRIYDHALNAEEVATLGDPQPILLPPYDQRGDGFARIVDGDGVNGPWLDMGAFEAQSVLTNDLAGDYNGNGTVDAADYVVWRKTISMNVPNGSGADGDGDGVVDLGDHGVWRENFGQTQTAAAGTVQAAGAAARAIEDGAAQALMRSATDGGIFVLAPSPVVSVSEISSSRGRSFRAVLRSQFEAAATRDDALLAWETARLAVVEQSPETHATLFGAKAAGSQLTEVHELADSDLSCKHFAAFDCAIESLGM
ncbi:MAG TPA: choice-of-anchor Q domain-containing protein, partial [Lacipirellulaceae bacterium]|nr:choice-of-anchor Q domain-containing protein [Lacipirellulaceae bacterium]